jgi:hypothetical protein
MVFEEGLDLCIEYMLIRKGNNKKNNGRSSGVLLRKHLLEDLFAAPVVSLIQVQYFQKGAKYTWLISKTSLVIKKKRKEKKIIFQPFEVKNPR